MRSNLPEGGMRVAVVGAVLLLMAAAGCTPNAQPVPSPPPPTESPLPDPLTVSTAVSFTTTDGVRLSGRLFGSGPNGVVLVHNYQGDQSEWWEFAEILAAHQFQALTYDTRGSCPGGSAGCSKGQIDGRTFRDVLAAIAVLKDKGARSIALIGGEFGAFQALQAAGQKDVDVSAVVSASFLSLFGGRRVVASVGEPKLFMSGKYDSLASASVPDLEQWARPIKVVKIMPTDARGTQMFTSVRAGTTAAADRQVVLDFLEEYGRQT